MKCLLISDIESDFSTVLESCGASITHMTFEEAVKSQLGISVTTHRRIVVVNDADKGGITGLEAGDLLDDSGNRMMRPWYSVPGQTPLLVYRAISLHTVNGTQNEKKFLRKPYLS